jgi:hypothetical protein
MNRIAFLLPLALTFAVGCGATSSLQTASSAAPSNITGFDPCEFVVCGWNPLGTTGVTYVKDISFVLDANSYPIIAWADNYRQVRVQRWTGNVWQSLGGVIGTIDYNDYHNRHIKLALEKDGTPVVAYNQDLSRGKEYYSRIVVTRWTSKGWQEYPGTPCGGFCYELWSLDMTLDLSDHPLVAFGILPGLVSGNYEYLNGIQTTIHSAIWNGTGWTSYQNLTGGRLISIVTNKDNQTFLALDGYYPNSYLFKLVGSNWYQIGNFSGWFNDFLSSHYDIQLDKDGSPVFDFSDTVDKRSKVYRWNGIGFLELGFDRVYDVQISSNWDITALKRVIPDPSLPCYDDSHPFETDCYDILTRYNRTTNKWVDTKIRVNIGYSRSGWYESDGMGYRLTKTGQPIEIGYSITFGGLHVRQWGPPPVLTQP